MISEHKLGKIASNWTSHHSFICMGGFITTSIHMVSEKISRYVYML